MATVEIPDDVLEALRVQAKATLLTDDPSGLLMQIVRGYLADVCAPGFDRDGLTGALTRQRLRDRVTKATHGASWQDRSIYSERFLCIDLDKFKRYLDVHGMQVADVVLRGLGHDLQNHYGKDDVYRVGGDEFVVVLGDRDAWLPDAPQDVTFAHAIVEVALHRNQRRNHNIYGWIETHLKAGVLSSKPGGMLIECGDPVWYEEQRT